MGKVKITKGKPKGKGIIKVTPKQYKGKGLGRTKGWA